MKENTNTTHVQTLSWKGKEEMQIKKRKEEQLVYGFIQGGDGNLPFLLISPKTVNQSNKRNNWFEDQIKKSSHTDKKLGDQRPKYYLNH